MTHTVAVAAKRRSNRQSYHSGMRNRVKILALLAMVAMSSQACAAEPTVYVTAKGKKYHTKNCRLKQGSKGVKLSEAKKKKYTACLSCKPPK